MPDFANELHYLVEIVKLIGAFASFYAVIKLRQIEKNYLFKATIPEVIENLGRALDDLNLALTKPADHKTKIIASLNCLQIDVKNVKRKARGDTLKAAERLLGQIDAIRPRRRFWQSERPMVLKTVALLEIYGMGMGLIRSLENAMKDQAWSAK